MRVNIAILAFTTVLLTAAPVMAGNPADPASPGSDKSVGVTPNDAQASPTNDAPASSIPKSTGAANPDTPDPTKNTPGAESKN